MHTDSHACASRAVGVHDRYENPVWSKSYRRLQLWYIVYTLYGVYTILYNVLPYWYTYMYCPYPGNGIIVHQWLFLDAHSRKIIPSTMQLKTNSESHWAYTHIRITGRLCHHFFQTDNVSHLSETGSKSTVFPALILVYTVIVTDQRKRNILPSQIVNLGFSWGVRREYLSDLWPVLCTVPGTILDRTRRTADLYEWCTPRYSCVTVLRVLLIATA